MENTLKGCILLIALSFALGAYAYPSLPEQSASHWNFDGEADGYSPRLFVAFFIPALLAALTALLVLLPRIDPLRANIESFRGHYYGFILAMAIFLAVIHAQAILWNLGYPVSFSLTMPILLGGLLFYLGIVLEKSKRNWFIGIRTPWTLSSDVVWERTHKAGGKVFKVAGILMLFGAVLPSFAFLMIIGLVVLASLGTAAYSYFVFREVEGGGKRQKR
ncbi:MAG: SdpI family protein [Candidatus Micrarchaeota archaeon]